MQPVASTRFPWLPWLALGAVALGLGFWLDERVDSVLDVTQIPSWKRIAWWCSKMAEGEIVGGIGVGLALGYYFFLKKPAVAVRIFYAAGASLLIGLAGTIIRVLVGRARPLGPHGPAGVPPGFYGVYHDGHWIIGQAAFSSFPSGHSAVAAGLAGVVTRLNRRWGLVCWLYSGLVMWSRVALQWHHLSDVIASAVLAFPMAWILEKYFLGRAEQRLLSWAGR